MQGVPVGMQRDSCPALRALIEAAFEADATPAGQELWAPAGNGPRFDLCHEPHDAAAGEALPPPGRPAALRMSRRSTREAGGVVRTDWHYVYVRRGAAAAEAFLRRNATAMVETHAGCTRGTAATLPPAARRLYAELLQKTRGTALVSSFEGAVAVGASGPLPMASASVVFVFGDVLHKIYASESLAAASAETTLRRALEYALALAAALLARQARAAAGDGAAAIDGAVDGFGGSLLPVLMALPAAVGQGSDFAIALQA